MRRGTTPTVEITVANEDGTPCDLTGQELHVTFRSAGPPGSRACITKRESELSAVFDGTATVLSITLTQAETLSFATGAKVRVQVRNKDGLVAQASDIAELTAEEILLEGEI